MQRICDKTVQLANREDDIYRQYNKMLTANRNTYCSNLGIDLSYDALMGSSRLNNGYGSARIVSDSDGRVVLNDGLSNSIGLTVGATSGAIDAEAIYKTLGITATSTPAEIQQAQINFIEKMMGVSDTEGYHAI